MRRPRRNHSPQFKAKVATAAPSTTYEAYRKAQEALQKLEDMTFSDEEIDAFLPKELKKANKANAADAH